MHVGVKDDKWAVEKLTGTCGELKKAHNGNASISMCAAEYSPVRGKTVALNRTHLFIDEPAETDEFGTHSRIAALIHDEIAESGIGHSIALVGDWGSGKSTVIRLLQKSSEKHKADGSSSVRAEIFIYDAWAHQGDPLRRSFLDDLNVFSRKNNLRTEEEELGISQRLWNRVEQTETTTEPIVQRHAKVLMASALLIPIGVKLLKFPKDLTLDTLLTARNFFAGALALTPAVIAAIYLLIFHSRSIRLRNFAFGNAWKSKHFGITSFLVEKIHGRAERKTIRTPNDSIVEFKNIFFDLVREVRARDPRVRLVIVLDNIDRLPADQARQFWSTMQTFFDDYAARRLQGPKFWLIAPFSRRALTNVFRDSSESNKSGASEEANEAAKRSAGAYMERVFQTTFYVPPLLVADWREYFLAKLRKAFEEHDAAELRDVRDLYDLVRANGPDPINPREMKLFINSLVMLYRQRGEDMPLSVLAAFLLHQTEIDGKGEALRSGTLLSPEELVIIGDENLRALFAALHFGVSPSEGVQLLLRDGISKALRAADKDLLQKEEAQYGFYHVLPNVIRAELARGDIDGPKLLNTAAILGSLRGAKDDALVGVWSYIRSRVLTDNKWNSFNIPLAEGITALLIHTPAEERERLAARVASQWSTAEVADRPMSEATSDPRAQIWAEAACALLENVSAPKNVSITAPGTPQFGLAILDALTLVDRGTELGQFISFPGNLTAALVAGVTAGHYLRNPIRFVNFAKSKPLEIRWANAVPPLKERLKVLDLDKTRCAAHVNTLLALRPLADSDEARAGLQELSVQGFLSHFVAVYAKDIELKAALVLATVLSNPGIQRQHQQGQSAAGDAAINAVLQVPAKDTVLFAEIVKAVLALNLAEVLLRLAAGNAQISQLVRRLTKDIVEGGYTFSTPAAEFLSNAGFWAAPEPVIMPSDFIQRMAERDALLQLLEKDGFKPDRAQVYVWALSYAHGAGRQAYLSFLSDGVQNLPNDFWSTALRDQNGQKQLMGLISAMKSRGVAVNVSTPLGDALREHVKELLKASVDTATVQRWDELFALLAEGTKTTVVANVLDDAAGAGDANFIRVAVAVIRDKTFAPALAQVGHDRVARRIFGAILKSPEPMTVLWIKYILTSNADFFADVSSATVADVRERLSEALKTSAGNQETLDLLQSIAALPGLVDKGSESEQVGNVSG